MKYTAAYATFQIAKAMGPTWGPPGSCRPQMGPMLAPWTMLSGSIHCLLNAILTKSNPIHFRDSCQPPLGILSQQSSNNNNPESVDHIILWKEVYEFLYLCVNLDCVNKKHAVMYTDIT